MKRNLIHVGDTRDVMRSFPDGFFQTVITSPPYWGLRDYGLEPVIWGGDPACEHEWESIVKPASSGGRGPSTLHGGNARQEQNTATRQEHASRLCAHCGAWRGSLGLEPTPELYVDHLVQIFREVRRVLRDDGTFWLNIGDSYAANRGNGARSVGDKQASNPGSLLGKLSVPSGLKPKDLALIPFRAALALQADGWWVRTCIPWVKTNGMPGSQTDRPTVSHEYVFLLSKSKSYYYDHEAVKVGYTEPMGRWGGDVLKATGDDSWCKSTGQGAYRVRKMRPDEAGRTRRTTDWYFDSLAEFFDEEFLALNVKTAPFAAELCKACESVYSGAEYKRLEYNLDDKGKKHRICEKCASDDEWLSHFACFPPKLVEPMILAGSSPMACPACGAPWSRRVEKKKLERAPTESALEDGINERSTGKSLATMRQAYRKIGLEHPPAPEALSWVPTCECDPNDGSGRCVVFDPFAGSGTTCAEALRFGRDYIGAEANRLYHILSDHRIAQMEKRLEREREAREWEARQLDMFDLSVSAEGE